MTLHIKLALAFVLVVTALASPAHAQVYRYVDEKGTIHFVDDISRIPERYRPDAEPRKTPREVRKDPPPPPKTVGTSPTFSGTLLEPEGFEVNLLRRSELWLAEVTLNDRLRQHYILDTGASFTLVSAQAAKDLGITIDENTPLIPGATVSGTILTPLVTLKSVRVGRAEAENVEAIVHTMPSGLQGLLGNSFLNKFRVVLDTVNAKMTLFPMRGSSSPDRPGGYTRDYWIGQFRFYQRNLDELRSLKQRYQARGESPELRRVESAMRFFENQLDELERKASYAGVPRQWRE